MRVSEQRVRWRLIDPDGVIFEFEADLVEACDLHQEFACVLAACPDVFGWRLVDLDSGTEYVPEEIEARIVARWDRQHAGRQEQGLPVRGET